MLRNGDPEALRAGCAQVLRKVPSPVALVTLRVDGRPWGVTVSSFVSVTLDPPKVLVSLFRHTLAARRILQNGTFGVSLLTVDHQVVAETSARPGTPKFMDSFCSEFDLFHVDDYGVVAAPDGVDELPLRPPRVAGADHLLCDLERSIVVDDHVLLVGRVTEVQAAGTVDEPLVYVNRSFATVAATGGGPQRSAPASGARQLSKE